MLDILDEFLLFTSTLWDGMKNSPENYQTLLGGGLAFVGVLVTVSAMGWRLKRQLDHATELDAARHQRELSGRRKAIKGALSAEISVITAFLKDEDFQLRKWLNPTWKTIEEESAQAPNDEEMQAEQTWDAIRGDWHSISREDYRFSLPERDEIYTALVGDIAVLEEQEIREIILTYDRFQSFKSWVRENCAEKLESSNVYMFEEAALPALLSQIEETRGEINWSLAELLDEPSEETKSEHLKPKWYTYLWLLAVLYFAFSTYPNLPISGFFVFSTGVLVCYLTAWHSGWRKSN